mmetsp:Transcript_6305/g.18559  ORF Transcript_6305/g.18559 Transcript_6305/m.18559 type:complete len:357 (+) Transcript_6305:472-1542(+)
MKGAFRQVDLLLTGQRKGDAIILGRAIPLGAVDAAPILDGVVDAGHQNVFGKYQGFVQRFAHPTRRVSQQLARCQQRRGAMRNRNGSSAHVSVVRAAGCRLVIHCRCLVVLCARNAADVIPVDAVQCRRGFGIQRLRQGVLAGESTSISARHEDANLHMEQPVHDLLQLVHGMSSAGIHANHQREVDDDDERNFVRFPLRLESFLDGVGHLGDVAKEQMALQLEYENARSTRVMLVQDRPGQYAPIPRAASQRRRSHDLPNWILECHRLDGVRRHCRDDASEKSRCHSPERHDERDHPDAGVLPVIVIAPRIVNTLQHQIDANVQQQSPRHRSWQIRCYGRTDDEQKDRHHGHGER